MYFKVLQAAPPRRIFRSTFHECCEVAHLLNFINNLHEAQQGVIEQGLLQLSASRLELPDQEEGITYILIWCTTTFHNVLVSNLCYLIHEEHHILLQPFSGKCELADVTKSKYRLNFTSWYHGIELPSIAQVVGNDLRPSRTESNLKQSCHLGDGSFEHVSLVLVLDVLTIFLLQLLQVKERVLAKLLHSVLHLLYGLDHDGVRVS
mmetsp:Transcript_14320/g.29449  ORF Transcript_14320/g.29449 Transcript_14320/m.29449 type:complete len:206 (+) Transcript_14320:666-1283(+)